MNLVRVYSMAWPGMLNYVWRWLARRSIRFFCPRSSLWCQMHLMGLAISSLDNYVFLLPMCLPKLCPGKNILPKLANLLVHVNMCPK